MENKTKPTKGITFDLRKYIVTCLRSWYVFVICIICCTALTLAYSVIKTPTVEVSVELMLKYSGGSSGLMMLGEMARSFSLGDMFGGSSSTDNEASVLRTHTVMINTVKDMDLNVTYLKPRLGIRWTPMQWTSPITLVAPPEMADTIRTAIQFDLRSNAPGKYDVKVKARRKVVAQASGKTLPFEIETPYGTFIIQKSAYDDPENRNLDHIRVLFSSYVAAAESYSKIVKIFVPDRKTDFIGLTYMAINPKFGEALLSNIIKNYTDISNEFNRLCCEQSLALVNQRLQSLSQELQMSESSLERFKKDNKLTDVEVDAQYLMTKNGTIEQALLQAQTNVEVLKMTRDFINNPQNNYALIPDLYVANVSSVGDVPPSQISQYNQMILERMELLNTVKESSTLAQQLDSKLDALRLNIISSINRSYQNAMVLYNDLRSENSRTQSRIGSLPTLERQYITLKRDNLLQEQLYLFLLQQREELTMSLASRSLPAQEIVKPYASAKPSGLTKMLAVLIGVFFGCVIGALWVFLKRMSSAPITSINDFISTNKAPLLGSLKKMPADTTDALTAGSPNAEPIRLLRSDLQTALANCEGNTVVVSSMSAGEGKTFVAVNLAESLAMLGRNVLLVDASLRRPSVAQILGITPSDAIEQCVLSDNKQPIEAKDIAVDRYKIDDTHSMSVITADTTAHNAADILGSERFAQLVTAVRADYDYVVIDGPQIDGYSDINYLTDVADVTLVVVRSGIATGKSVDYINHLYEVGTLKRIGIVTNAFK